MDGVDVREHDLQTLRKEISVVMQDVFLFSDTIKRNILFGYDLDYGTDPADDSDPGLEDKMAEASRTAHIHDFVAGMRDGYDTTIGERGIGLSGGQKQRISIARAIARDSGVLILDDSTSALDLDTEHQVWGAIGKRQGVTKLIITHRVSAVKDADEIIYLADGKVAERGTHNKLLELKGRYFETWLIQQKGQELCP